jgi:hypothetical protein
MHKAVADRKPEQLEISRQEQGLDVSDYERHLAAEIVAMLPYVRRDAWRILRLVHEMLNMQMPLGATGELREP